MPRFSIGYAPSLRLGCPPPCQRELTVRCLGGPAHGGGPFICLKDTRARSESKPVNHPFWARELPDVQQGVVMQFATYPYGNKGVPKRSASDCTTTRHGEPLRGGVRPGSNRDEWRSEPN